MINSFLVKRKLNKLLDRYESIFSDRVALLANTQGIRSILDAQAGLLHCDLLELGVAYDNLLYQLPTWRERADYITKSKGVPNTSRLVLVTIKQHFMPYDIYDKSSDKTLALEAARNRVDNLVKYKNDGFLGPLFYSHANMKMSKELDRVKLLAESLFKENLFDGVIDLFVSRTLCVQGLNTIFTLLDTINNPSVCWRPLTHESTLSNLADILSTADGTIREGDVIFLPKG